MKPETYVNSQGREIEDPEARAENEAQRGRREPVEILKNGARVLKKLPLANHPGFFIVLAETPETMSDHRFATWEQNPQGDTYHGTYHEELIGAFDELNERANPVPVSARLATIRPHGETLYIRPDSQFPDGLEVSHDQAQTLLARNLICASDTYPGEFETIFDPWDDADADRVGAEITGILHGAFGGSLIDLPD